MHTVPVVNIVRKIWPVLLTLALFVGMSYLVKSYLYAFEPFMQNASSGLAILVFFLLGIASVIVPFASILPFIPLAVTLWSWPVTGLMVLASWVIGSQILFETTRRLGKPFVVKHVPPGRMDTIAKLVQGKGILHAILVRMLAGDDMVSYAFGLFTNMTRWEFFFVSLIGMAPGAFLYAYFGDLPVSYQFTFGAMGVAALIVYWVVSEKYPSAFRFLRLTRDSYAS